MIYDIDKCWLDNFGTVSSKKNDDIVNIPDNTNKITYNFLGYHVSTKVGIAAGPLLNSDWISYASKLDTFSVLTYKTIQSEETIGHPLPNIVYVADDLSISTMPTKTITNSFGMPSMPRKYLEEDIPKAMNSLKKNQVLVLSITGKNIEDLRKTADIARNTKVPIIEINLSCPNVLNTQGDLYLSPELIYDYITEVRKTNPTVSIIVKVGKYPTKELQEKCIVSMFQAGANAVSGINSIKKHVNGFPRNPSGVCGELIKEDALDFVCKTRKIIDKLGINLTLIGVGGITTRQDAHNLLNAGADFVQSATGFLLDPLFMREDLSK